MGAPALEHAVECLRPLGEGGRELFERVEQLARPVERGDPHRGGERVVGRLRHVDVVVGADDRVVAAQARADAVVGKDLDGAVGQHLVGVHVVAHAGTGLEGIDPKVADQLGPQRLPLRRIGIRGEAEDLVRCLNDGRGEMIGKAAGCVVGARGGLLDLDRRTHESRRPEGGR